MCDRTNEFLNIINNLSQNNNNNNNNKLNNKNNIIVLTEPKTRSDFYEATAEIGLGIQLTSQMLSQLTKLVRRQGLFDDSSQEIDNMIYNVKQQLTELNSKCDNAQIYVDSKKSNYGKQNQLCSHNGTVVNQLKSDLMIATQDFKSVLEMRTIKMKEQNKRKIELTGNGILSPTKQIYAAQMKQKQDGNKKIGINNLPNPYIDLMKKSPYNPYNTSTSSSSSSFLNNNNNNDNNDIDLEQQTQSLLVVPPSVEAQYYDSRERAVNEVEKTIAELGTIFQRLSTMISEQQHLVERIDEDIETATTNTNSARDYFLTVYNNVSSNRGMYMKLGGIFIIFIILFTLFLM